MCEILSTSCSMLQCSGAPAYGKTPIARAIARRWVIGYLSQGDGHEIPDNELYIIHTGTIGICNFNDLSTCGYIKAFICIITDDSDPSDASQQCSGKDGVGK